MPARVRVLSDSDVETLRDIIARVRRDRVNTTGRPDVTGEEGASPNLYVARTPAGGVPALTEEAGAGIVDTPGSADCDVYFLSEETAGTVIRPVSSMTQRVHNLSATAMPGDTWVPVGRTTHGLWLAFPAGGGGTPVAFSGARVHNSTNVTLTWGAFGSLVTLTYDSERFDTDNYHSTVSDTGRLVAAGEGYYHIGGHVTCSFSGNPSPPASWTVSLWVYKGGTLPIAVTSRLCVSSNAENSYLSVSTLYFLGVGDYVELKVAHSYGTAGTVIAAPATNHGSPEFWITKVGTPP